MKKEAEYNILIFLTLFFSFFIISSDLISQSSNKNIERSQPWKWEFLGPYGGDINKISINPDDPQKLYILVSSLGNIFYSKNQGNSWEKIAGFNRYCSDMAVDPHDPKTFFVISSSYVFKSTDSGKNWDTIDMGQDCKLNLIAIDPLDPQKIYITGSYGSKEYQAVFRSKNGGETWVCKIINASVTGGGTYTVAISPLDPSIILISGYYRNESGQQNRLYKTTNFGTTWKEVTNPINALMVSAVFDPQDSQRIYTISSWGLYLSSDGGITWNKARDFGWGYYLTVDPLNPNIVYAGANGSVYKSSDKGESWIQYNNGLKGSCNTLAVRYPTIYFGSEYGLFKSQDEGQTWTSSHRGIGNMKINLLAVSPSSPNVIYARSEDAGFYKTQDSGKTWVELESSLSCNSIQEFILNPQNSQELFALSGG